MTFLNLNNFVYDAVVIVNSGYYSVECSSFVGFHRAETGAIGSCILCSHSVSNLNIYGSTFLSNFAQRFAAGVAIDRCRSATIMNSCFAHNTARYSADVYAYNTYQLVMSLYFNGLMLYRSIGTADDSHGFCVGSENLSTIKNINQSFINMESSTYGLWMIYKNNGDFNFDYILSSNNSHKSIFNNQILSSGISIIINDFCCLYDRVEKLIYLNEAKSFVISNSIFIFSQDLKFDVGCDLNLSLIECRSNIFS